MTEPAENNASSLEADDADQRLMHALLVHVYDEQASQHRQGRVRRVMRAIGEPAAPQLRFPAWARRAAFAAAAVILVAAGAWVLTGGATPALASLDDILGALGRPGDRTYRIRMEDLPEPPGRRPPDNRPPDAAPRPGLDAATLYLRDGRQYLLVRRDPRGGQILDGYDGRQSWRIKGGSLAEKRDGPGAGGIPMPPLMAGVPFSDLHQTLERIRVDFTVVQFDQAPLSAGGQTLRHVKVRRNSREVKGPDTIEIWAEPHSGMPMRIVFDDAKIQGNPAPCRLTFDLVSQQPLGEEWFSPAPHLSGG